MPSYSSLPSLMTVLLICASILLTQSSFDPISSAYINSPIGAQAISPNGRFDETKIIYFDLDTSRCIIRNTTSNQQISSFENSMPSNVRNIEWLNSKKIAMTGSNWFWIVDDQNYSNYLLQVLPETSTYKICVSRGIYTRVTTYLEQSTQIVIYGASGFLLVIATNGVVSTITFDQTGKYLYYIESFANSLNRIVYSIDSRNVYNKNSNIQYLTSIISTPRITNSDITVAYSSSQLQIYDDYKPIYYYYTPVSYSMMKFTNDGFYIFASTKTSLDYISISYIDYNLWNFSRNFITLDNETISSFTIGSDYIGVYTSEKNFYVFEYASSIGLIILIIFGGIILFFILAAFLVFIYFKVKQRLQNRSLKSKQMLVDHNNNSNQEVENKKNPYGYLSQNNSSQENENQKSPYGNQNNTYGNQRNQVISQDNGQNYQPPRNW